MNVDSSEGKVQKPVFDQKPLEDSDKITLANVLSALNGPICLECDYQDWFGTVTTLRFEVEEFWCGSTLYYPQRSLMLRARDIVTNARIDIRVKDLDVSTLRILKSQEVD